MGGFLSALGQKLAERWLTLLVLPGTLFLATATVAHIVGHAHALEYHRLTERITHWAQAPATSNVGGQVVLLGAVLAAAAAAGLAAQGLGTLVQLTVLAANWQTWPGPLRRCALALVTRRRARWTVAADRYLQQLDADARFLAVNRGRADPASRLAAYNAMQRIAAEEPARPTWSGDRVHSVSVRLERDHHLDLPVLWPHLWIILPESTRAEITTAEQALIRATTLGGWALMYTPLTVWWWPAAPLAAILALTARHRFRSAIDAYAQLLEAAVRIHATDLAARLGIDHSGLADPVGDAVMNQLRPRTPSTSPAFPDAEVATGIVGGLRGETRPETHARPTASWQSVALVVFLISVILTQLFAAASGDDRGHAGADIDANSGSLSWVAIVLSVVAVAVVYSWLLLTRRRGVVSSGSTPSPSVSGDAQHRRAEGRHIVWLAVGAGVAYAAAYLTGRPVLDSIQSNQLGPSETAQVITAIGALGSAIGLSAAAVIKAVALLIHARADMERARSGQPRSEPELDPASGDDQAGAL
ncbi:hypothetical protein [Streptomyces mirabilis]